MLRHLVKPGDFTVQEIDSMLDLGLDIKGNPEKYMDACKGKLLGTLFYEPSTRTRLSFESAMNRLGGRVVGFSNPSASSVAKGESLEDTIKVVGQYVDVIAMRHPVDGSASRAIEVSEVPFINAGDGKNEHPTQTLTDLLTIKAYKGSLNNLTIGMCGDLKYGRTVHSLAKAMSRYTGIKFIFISPDELRMPESVKDEIEGVEFEETSNLEESIKTLDILYMTRIQKERFEDPTEYERLKDSYVLDMQKMKSAKEDMMILHPLPRVNEIATEVDSDERAKYFEQAKFGMYVRMALILTLLNL